MNNLFSILKRNFFKLIGKKLKLWCDAYTYFLEQFLTLYDPFFPIKKIQIKAKDLQSPWIANGIKRQQRLYDKFLKNRNEDNETKYNYKKLFEAIKKVLKITTFPN